MVWVSPTKFYRIQFDLHDIKIQQSPVEMRSMNIYVRNYFVDCICTWIIISNWFNSQMLEERFARVESKLLFERRSASNTR